jgi:hypothetical protein
MLKQEAKDELFVQLILMGVSLVLTAALYWLILMPQWKRQRLMIQAVKIMEDGSKKVHELTGKEMLLVREFAQRVSEWDHAQLRLSRKKETTNAVPESESTSPKKGHCPQKSD